MYAMPHVGIIVIIFLFSCFRVAESLSLPVNDLTGTIPTELGLLPRIRELILNYNELTGTVPTELGQLTTISK